MRASDTLGLLAVIGIGAVVLMLAFWQYGRARTLLQEWMREHGYTILEAERRDLRRGPFFWTTARGQIVYHVVVRDHSGNGRSAWVRCGGWWLGMLSDRVEVVWET
jgi:hypothetical protein